MIVIGLMLQFALVVQPARAQDPPPRPTVEPTQVPTMTPSPTPLPTQTPAPPDDGSPSPTEVASGRIIGTVINLTTNAPTPGITVMVGNTTVTTDANGNYERGGLAAGTYQVALVLTAAQGEAAQGPITIELAAGATAVQHLAFRSPVAATPTATTAPTVIPSTPTAVPPTVVPPTPTSAAPVTLPDTGDTSGQTAGGLVTVLGVLVLLAGITVWGTTEWSRRQAIKRRSF